MAWWRRRKTGAAPERPAPVMLVTEEFLRQTTAYLQRVHGADAHEEVVYWAGRTTPVLWVGTTVIAPDTHTTPGSFKTSSSANADVVAFLAAHRLELLAQVHTHPGVSVGHSRGDDAGALMPYQGFLSIVVPYHGRGGMGDLTACGVHRFEGRRFRHLSVPEVRAAFHVIPAAQSFRREDSSGI